MSSLHVIKDHHARPDVTDGHGQDLPQSTLSLMLEMAARQHQMVLELQTMFMHKGGELSPIFLTEEAPKEEIFQLDDAKSIAVLNFSAVTVYLGMGGASASPGNGFPIPASSFLQLPVVASPPIEVAGVQAELAGVPQAMIAFIRFRHLVHLAAGPLAATGSSGGASAIVSASAVTSESPRSVVVGAASAPVIAANTERKGLSIENTGKEAVSLGLGAAAVLGDDIVVEPAGSWDGTISGVLWRGAVNAIAAAASTLAVVEV
jgi:hypothetical protein